MIERVCDVVVIDTLSAVTPGANENSSEDMSAALQSCKFISKALGGALVVLIHHSGKDASKGARGHSSLRAAADAEIEITRNGDYRTAAITKQKDGSDGEQFGFKLKVVELEPLHDEPQSSCIVEVAENGAGQSASNQERLGPNEITVLQVLEIMAPVGTCAIEDLVEGAKRKFLRKDGKEDRRRDTIKRAIEGLVRKHRAYFHGEDRVALTNLQTRNWEDE